MKRAWLRRGCKGDSSRPGANSRDDGVAQCRMGIRTNRTIRGSSFRAPPLACSTRPHCWKAWLRSRPNSRPSWAAALVRASKVAASRSEEHTSELQSLRHLVCRLLLEKKKKQKYTHQT